MAAAPQRFPLPNMPFRREIHSGCAIGTSITCTAQAFKTKEKSFTIQLSTTKDIAILVTVPIAKSGKITASARIDGKFTSEVDKAIFVPLETKFTIKLHTTQYVTEVFFNNTHMLDFVHRISPADIREVAIEGPLIVDEVVFTPPQGALLDPVPSYEQATSSTDMTAVPDLQRMNLGPSNISQKLPPTPMPPSVPSAYSVLTPTPAPPQIGLSPSIVNQPMPGLPPAPTPAGTIQKTSDLSQNRAQSTSASLNPFQQDMSMNKPPIYENSPKYAPTPFQQAQSSSSSSTATPYYVTSPSETPYPPPSSIQPLQSQTFSNQPVQPYQSPPLYPTSSQAVAVPPYPSSSQQSIFPQPHVPTSVPQQSVPQPYGVQQQYPHAGQNPYMNPYQYPQTLPGVQMQSPYNAYHQVPPLQYAAPQGPYATGYPGYAPQYYSNYPVMYGSGCHGYRRSNSCCSD